MHFLAIWGKPKYFQLLKCCYMSDAISDFPIVSLLGKPVIRVDMLLFCFAKIYLAPSWVDEKCKGHFVYSANLQDTSILAIKGQAAKNSSAQLRRCNNLLDVSWGLESRWRALLKASKLNQLWIFFKRSIDNERWIFLK